MVKREFEWRTKDSDNDSFIPAARVFFYLFSLGSRLSWVVQNTGKRPYYMLGRLRLTIHKHSPHPHPLLTSTSYLLGFAR